MSGRLLLLATLACALLGWLPADVAARAPAHRAPALATVALADLPEEARLTLARMRAGGPFRYEKDGAVFGNFERRLPRRPRGYYHEFTVPTPGARDRGARRLISGGDPRSTDEVYYTGDHYRTFVRIRE